MKILVISHNCVLASSQERMVELARLNPVRPTLLVPPRNLEAQGMVALEKTSDPRYEIVKGRPLFSFLFGQRYLQYYPFLWTLLRRVRPSIIDLHEEPWSLVAFHTIFLRNLLFRDAKVVVETEQNIHKNFPFPFSFFERYVLRHANGVIARNREVAEIVTKKGCKGKTALIPNGLDTNLFRKKDVRHLKERLGLSRFVVGFLGRLEKEKGVDDLLKAAATVEHPIDLLLIGTGSYERELKKLAASLAFSGTVVWHPAVPQSEVPDFLNCMDVMVLPSRTTLTWKEQFGRTLTEAMACEVPVIGSDSGAIPEVIGDAGIVFPEGDTQMLKESIEKLICSPQLRSTLVEKGLHKVRIQFAWSAVAQQMMNFFEEL